MESTSFLLSSWHPLKCVLFFFLLSATPSSVLCRQPRGYTDTHGTAAQESYTVEYGKEAHGVVLEETPAEVTHNNETVLVVNVTMTKEAWGLISKESTPVSESTSSVIGVDRFGVIPDRKEGSSGDVEKSVPLEPDAADDLTGDEEALTSHTGEGNGTAMPVIEIVVHGAEAAGVLEGKQLAGEESAGEMDGTVMQPSEKEAAASVLRGSHVMTFFTFGGIAGFSDVGKSPAMNTTSSRSDRPVYPTVQESEPTLTTCDRESPAASRKVSTGFTVDPEEPSMVARTQDPTEKPPADGEFDEKLSEKHTGGAKDNFSFHLDFSVDASGTQKTSEPKHEKHHEGIKRYEPSDFADCRIYELVPCGNGILNEEECEKEGCCWITIYRRLFGGCASPRSPSSVVVS